MFIALCLLVLAMFSSQSFWVISSDGRWFVRLVQLSALLAVLGAIVAVLVAVDTWRAPGRKLSLSIGRTALAAACLVWAYCRHRLPLPVDPAAVLRGVSYPMRP